MAKVKVRNVEVLNNECDLFSKFSFKIVFEALENIDEDIEWRLIYVGSAENSKYDQTLDSVLVGPIPRGVHKFLFDVTNVVNLFRRLDQIGKRFPNQTLLD
uniref:Histone chaperone asf1b-A (Trinotate prediction) n=1 Tax=Myxobolus squamalis TaxID=59785 RepID=A0A6B2G4Z7_MYXSQ